MSVAVFPGQGVQAAGMDLGLARRAGTLFETASELLGADMAELCETGTAGTASLDSTKWAQPAILVCSLALHTALGETSTAAVGHSVGEYGALVTSGALTFSDAVTLIAKRAEAMADAAEQADGAMAALMRFEIEDALALCEEFGVALAGDNAPGQCVIAGATENVEAAMAAAAAKRAVTRRLDVAGAFHSPLMAPATDALRDALSSVAIEPPSIAFWSSVTATRLDDPEAIRSALLAQLEGCVRWREAIAAIAASGESVFTDIGPGKIVGPLARRIAPDAEIRYAVDELEVVSTS